MSVMCFSLFVEVFICYISIITLNSRITMIVDASVVVNTAKARASRRSSQHAKAVITYTYIYIYIYTYMCIYIYI